MMPLDPALNPAAILAALRITNTTAITPVHGGADTTLWRVEHGPTTYALRVFRRDQVATYHRELMAMGLAHHAHLPVPTVHATAVWQGRPALLLSWCPGSPFGQTLQQHPWRVWSLARAFGRMQAHIHAVHAPTLATQPSAEWIAWAGPDEPRLQATLRRTASKEAALLHLDYHPLNVLTDGTQITAVLDWANARGGDPRADVARTYTILVVEPYGPGRQALALGMLRRLLAWSWRRGYEEVAGPLQEMAPFYAWAGAVMVRDLAPRVTDPQSWWQPHHLEQIRGWTRRWKQHAVGTA
jgi:aminoglycoside phosphotransferase (APT) family kinase protein